MDAGFFPLSFYVFFFLTPSLQKIRGFVQLVNFFFFFSQDIFAKRFRRFSCKRKGGGSCDILDVFGAVSPSAPVILCPPLPAYIRNFSHPPVMQASGAFFGSALLDEGSLIII